MNLMAECEVCKERFSLGNDVIVKREFKYNGKSIWLTYYDCPNCKKRHIVQIDNEQTNKLLDNIKQQVSQAIAIKNSDVLKTRKSRYNADSDKLKNLRKELISNYSDKIIYDEQTNDTFILRFSVWT